MENNTKRYWRGIEELTNNSEFVKYAHREFGDAPIADEKTEALIDGTNTVRRDFLKVLGFGVSAVALAACEAPIKKAIPYLNKPEDGSKCINAIGTGVASSSFRIIHSK